MIKVFIEREVAEELAEQYNQLARQNLQYSMASPGFISGEVLHDISAPQKRLIVATYRSFQDWNKWYHSDERRAIMEQIGPMLEHEEKISIYQH